MANPDAVLTVNFNMKIDPATDEKLIALASLFHMSKAAVLRKLIRATHNMTVSRIPTCADDTPCRCPHAHVASPHLPPPIMPTNPDQA